MDEPNCKAPHLIYQEGMMVTREMQKALEADGEKLRQLTGQEHGPFFEVADQIAGEGMIIRASRAREGAIEVARLRILLRQINARAKAMPGDDLKELQRQMLHIESLSRLNEQTDK